MKWTNSYRSFGLKTKRSTGLKTIEHKHVRLLAESWSSYSSETKAVEQVAKDPGMASESLRRRGGRSDATAAAETKRSAQEAMAELKRLRAENTELRRANEILTTAPAFSAAGLDPTRR